MKSHAAQKDGAKESSKTGSRPAGAGPSLSAAPPAYGIGFVDEMLMDGPTVSAQSAHVLQPQAAASAPPANASGSPPIGPPNDPLGKEADRLTDRLLGKRNDAPGWFQSHTAGVQLQRKCACQGQTESCDDCGKKKADATDSSQAPVLRRAPALGWTGSKNNAGKTSVTTATRTIERIPIEGLSAPSVSGRVIVLLTSPIDLAKPVDILFHLHGHNEGYENLRDRDIEKIEEQLAGSARGQMIAVLPQGTSKSSFGKGTGHAGLDSDAYLDSVFDALTALGVWKTKPPRGQVLLSAHSGGGETDRRGDDTWKGGSIPAQQPQGAGALRRHQRSQ